MQKEAQVYLTKFLKLLQEVIPTGEANHNFQFEGGFLVLWIMVDDRWQSIVFNEEYDDYTPEELVDDIVTQLKIGGYKIQNKL